MPKLYTLKLTYLELKGLTHLASMSEAGEWWAKDYELTPAQEKATMRGYWKLMGAHDDAEKEEKAWQNRAALSVSANVV